VRSPESSLTLERTQGSSLFLATIQTASGTSETHFPGGNLETTALLCEELTPGPRHRVYQKAAAILELLIR